MKVNEHFFGVYKDADGFHLIHWAGDRVDTEELQRRSTAAAVVSMFPTPSTPFVRSEALKRMLERVSSQAGEMYEDCDGLYIAVPRWISYPAEYQTRVFVTSVTKADELQYVADAIGALNAHEKGAWIRLIFVFRDGNRIHTQAEDAYFQVSGRLVQRVDF